MDLGKAARFLGISTIVAFVLAGGTVALRLDTTPLGAGLILLTGAAYFLVILGCVILPLLPNTNS
jgi:hypothetical protein